ncbi:MAG TPA: desampylase [Candidatus Thermoplasmatota archaeon]|nr:desampylase [Candidatus Thermoplasmatota archaeon]
MTRLRIPRSALDEVVAHAREAAPAEACGILAGDLAEPREVRAALRVRNAHPHPDEAYLLDPAEQLRALVRVEEELRLDVVGFYHSHPDGPPRPSATDAAEATWPRASHVLVWLRPVEGFGAWRWEGGRFVDERIEAF